ncbi:hypothetical protein [Salimicrobium album]|uniref:YqaI-like protein n=1 Tax=Salimicrobium album TaxID=50717 RepID=A0A1H3D5R3_9BACI|nr:hypothetical protein [Salimicrobium album]SDX61650.1 hypothetical protein SAMN04488081_0837 [Salimicrobium album]
MNHPVVEKLEREGLPEAEVYGVDGLGNEVYVGDEIYVIDDEYFLKETLTAESQELLQTLKASEEVAQ